jgi:hypothetical protein
MKMRILTERLLRLLLDIHIKTNGKESIHLKRMLMSHTEENVDREVGLTEDNAAKDKVK